MSNEDEVAATIQDQIDYIKEQKDAISDLDTDEEKLVALREINLEIQQMTVETLEEELELIKGQKIHRIYSVETGWTWTADQEAIADKEQEILDAQTEAQTTAIDNQIDSWEDYKEELKEFLT